MYNDYSDEKGENEENTNKKVYDTRHKELFLKLVYLCTRINSI
jgi:hypothetical protein